MAKYKRVYILAGHYGSGKTNVAVNLALKIKQDGYNVKIADLDIVNPYFRTKDSLKELTEADIQLISPAFANTNVDLPALPQEAYSLVQQKDFYAVLDVGGDDRGAYALGRYAPYIKEENNYEMCFVFNCYRPLTRTAEEALEVMKEIEFACKIPFTAIINNSNIGNDTDAEIILSSQKETERLSKLTGLPVIYTTIREDIDVSLDNKLTLKLQEKYFDIKES
ncbi:MAG: hypothetical protein E7365_04290 [Clostridiales bacterium]|nr:hypothetical protein [Clostridiales bacterium]